MQEAEEFVGLTAHLRAEGKIQQGLGTGAVKKNKTSAWALMLARIGL
jgi:hypothetical protein